MQRSAEQSVAVVGGGIAGVCVAHLLNNRGFRVELFEKHTSLGGCAGSFTREGVVFNVGATTVAGLNPDYPVRELLEEFRALDQVEISEPSIVFHTRKGTIKRYSDLERSIDEINQVFPHRENIKFWSLVYKLTEEILKHRYFHNFTSCHNVFKSLLNMRQLITKYYKFYFSSAVKGLSSFFNPIDKDYLSFMDSHVRIVAQCSIEEVNMITLLLSLGYPFTGVGYAKTGMGELIKHIANVFPYHLRSEVIRISRWNRGFIVRGEAFEKTFDRVVVAIPIFENLKIIEDLEMKSYLTKYLKLRTDSSAIVFYGVVEDFQPKELFHLFVIDKPIPYTNSSYLFVSFSKSQADNKTALTVSTHTSAEFWKNLRNTQEYEERKEVIVEEIKKFICKNFNIKTASIKAAFLATPESFYRYIGRRSVGGIPISRENTVWRIPSNFTPFKGFYLAGDSFFCHQGWIGVSIGVRNLVANFHEDI